MDVELICIGDELLDGRVRDRHATRLGEFLDVRGHRLATAHLVRDDLDAIGRRLEAASQRVELAVVSGGLGPTRDDCTRRAAARWADRDLVFRDDLREQLVERFDRHGYTFTENNERQCYVPEDAEVVRSDIGTASAFRLETSGLEAWFLPGVPREFRWYLREHLADRLAEVGDGDIERRRLTFLGLGESGLETRLESVTADADDRGVSVGFRADAPLVGVELRGSDGDALDAVRDGVLEEIGDWLVTEGDVDLPERLGEQLEARGETVASAESCTAGWVGKTITEVPGSSGWFEYGFVTYADEAKRRLLGVLPETLENHGAVSPEVVRSMAAGARRRADAEHALAISGIAGPSGGTAAKPVGTVDFGLATPDGVFDRRLQFPAKSRASVRRRSVRTAIGLLFWYLADRLRRHDVEGPTSYADVPNEWS